MESTFDRPVPRSDGTLSRQDEVALAVGRIVFDAAMLDAELTQLVAVLVNPRNPPRSLVYGRMTGDKLKMLAAVLPEEWEDAKELVHAIKRIIEDRNSVAHAALSLDTDVLAEYAELGNLDWDKVPLVLMRERNVPPQRIDLDELFTTRVDLQLLRHVTFALWIHVIFAQSPDFEIALPSLPTWVLRWGDSGAYRGWPQTTLWEADVSRAFRLR